MPIRGACVLLVAGCLAGGCATSSASPTNDRPPELPPSIHATTTGAEIRLSNRDDGISSELPATPERVWTALIEVFEDFDFEPDIIDTRSRQLGMQRLTRATIAGQRADALARCANEGAGPSAASRFRISFGFVSRVLKDGNDSILHTRVQASATPVDGSSIGQVGCVSTGRLEQRILAGVALKLGLQPPGDR